MVRFRRKSFLTTVQSRKNIKQDVAIIAAAATGTFTIAAAIDTMPALAATASVVNGSRINTFYLEVWIMGNAVEGVNSPFVWQLDKDPGGNLTFSAPSSAGASDNKRWIFAMGKGLIGSQVNGQPGYVIRGWFSIPKNMRKMGTNDVITLRIENNTANDLNVCRLAIYKWYF